MTMTMTMTLTARERLAALLGGVAAVGSFSTRRAASAGDLHIDVRGLGRLVLPVSEAQAKQLHRVGRPAAYGRGDRTLVDPRFRDTCEIPKSRVKIDKRQWNNTLLPMVERVRGDLGLPAGCRLKVVLHSMLVYGPGQFFVPHQDSEKADEKIGSLVVTLPGSFKGGALVVQHGGETATYRGSKTSLSFVAFYADCRHEIRPVTSGHRIVLTYDLLLAGDHGAEAPIEVATEVVAAVAGCLDEHFATLRPSRRPAAVGVTTVAPNRLVYLLDHDYTERGLAWSRLKGRDARRAGVLRAAGAASDCDVVLALADLHETWSSVEREWSGSWSGRRSRRWGDDSDDDEPEAVDPDDLDAYELDELLDWRVTLDSWIAEAGGPAEPVTTVVGDDEVCASTPTVDMAPYSSGYEGYMGNYGNTMDRWYHRGALVLWPRSRAFAVRAEASPAWGLNALSLRIASGDVADARDAAATLALFWSTVVPPDARGACSYARCCASTPGS